MIRHTVIRVALVFVVAAAASAAYAASMTLGTVRITQPVLANGQPLSPGTYEVRLTDQYLQPNPGQSPDAVRFVEFVKDGQVVARDAAEVVAREGSPVGTSGRTAGSTPLKVEGLKADDFIRISANREGLRYLIYLPLAK